MLLSSLFIHFFPNVWKIPFNVFKGRGRAFRTPPEKDIVPAAWAAAVGNAAGHTARYLAYLPEGLSGLESALPGTEDSGTMSTMRKDLYLSLNA